MACGLRSLESERVFRRRKRQSTGAPPLREWRPHSRVVGLWALSFWPSPIGLQF